jgi:hypothetical protein
MSADKAHLGRKGKTPKSYPDQTQTAHNKTVLRSNIHLEKQNNNSKAEDPNSVQLAEERSEEKKTQHNPIQKRQGEMELQDNLTPSTGKRAAKRLRCVRWPGARKCQLG